MLKFIPEKMHFVKLCTPMIVKNNYSARFLQFFNFNNTDNIRDKMCVRA